MQPLFTIGHSNHPVQQFIESLRTHAIEWIADVRSQPYSRFHPQSRREILRATLQSAGIGYEFLGRELGARRDEPESYVEGQARYDLIERLPAFAAGIEQLMIRAKSHRTAILCAERDPIDCHRFVLICRHLRNRSFEITHILGDGSLEGTDEIERRLIEKTAAATAPPPDLFAAAAPIPSQEDQLSAAYAARAREIAYRQPTHAR